MASNDIIEQSVFVCVLDVCLRALQVGVAGTVT